MYKKQSHQEWKQYTLGELSRPKQWPTVATSQLASQGFPVFGANGKIGFFRSYTHAIPTVAITCRGATCGNVHITEPYSYITGNAMALDDLNEKVTTTSFLARALEHRGLDDCITGSAQPQIVGSTLRQVTFALPPLAEQRRIAEILDTLDEAIRQTEALLAKLQQMKQGLLHDLLTRGIGADGALRPPHEEAPALYKDSPLGKIPKDWKKTPIAELADIFSGGTPSRNVPVFWNGGIPWVTPSELTNLQSKYITKTKEHISHAGMAGSSAILLPSNTLLVTTRATIGLVALSGMPITTNQGFKSIRFRFLALPDFYFYLFPLLISEMKRKASGTTFLEISAKEFGQIKLLVPPLSEQKRIVEILDAQDEAIQTQRLELAKLQMLKAGLMEDLLTGRVRVPVVEEGEG